MTEARANLVPGKRITKAVSLLQPLSSGGMGAVWLGDHHGLKTRVVVKFMLVGLDSSESARTRFSREAAAAAQVKSPHVVQMLDHGVSDDGVPFIVMEHLEGHDLGQELQMHGALDPAKVVAIVVQVAKALSKVHAAGLLHRDIKPENIFLCTGEEDIFVKLLDFGIAKSSSVEHGDGSLDGETKTGQIVGTPFYMSPEQVTAQKTLDHRSDLWSLGVVAYQALTGERPFDGPSFGALAVKIATGTPRRPTEVNPSLPPAVDAWFARACARSPADRFASAKELADGLRAAFEGVVSLPGGAISGDSGQRSRQRPSSPEREPPLGLAKTALDDSEAARRDAALGSAGLSVGGGERRSLRPVFVAASIALTVAVAGVLVWSARSGPKAPDGPRSAPPVAASGPTPTPTARALASSAPKHEEASALPDAGAEAPQEAGVDATSPADGAEAPSPSSATGRAPPTTRPNGHPVVPPPNPVSTKPQAQPTTSSPASSNSAPAKPASTEPDLF